MTPREKYRVLRKLDSGGMAEVFVGEAESLEGFKKRVAIKRVLPHLAENKKFLAMFLDEARLSLRLNHANVVQVFDIGHSANTYFIVMEYVDGCNLRTVMEHMRHIGHFMPMELACFIMTEVCRGLSYAHGLEDSDGKMLGIVHRDVSPPNILLSKEGEVKLVDFGLAKATSQLETTDPGVVKGKFAYLSPESAWAQAPDQRTDVFAGGIILWELLTSQRLFLGQTDVETIELVRRAEVPSLQSINPEVPFKLENIVRKALAAPLERRFQTASEFAEALAGFLFEHGKKVSSFDLQRLVRKVLESRPRQQTAKPSIIDQLIQEELGRFSSLESPRGLIGRATRDDETGSVPLDPHGFAFLEGIDGSAAGQGNLEDPREWAEEVSGVETLSPLEDTGESSAWIEAGSARISTPSRGLSQVPVPAATSGNPVSPELSPLAHMLEGGEVLRMGAEPESVRRNHRLVLAFIVLGALTAIAAGVVAYIKGWVS
ncbi:MAG: serine/threonine protein kinase [Myxococcota bacterium]|jgi:serine/threonine-protein kinase|nr:serine/threonine protein kinase [Myxococcota bacterium]